MKKNEKKSLPKFKAVTLGEDELSKAVVRGGCTCDTSSACHVDGSYEGDDNQI